MSRYNIKKFNLNIIRENSKNGKSNTCIIIGKRCIGKSTLISDIMYYLQEIPYGLVISKDNRIPYQSYYDSKFIHKIYSNILINKLITHQNNILKDNNIRSNNIPEHYKIICSKLDLPDIVIDNIYIYLYDKEYIKRSFLLIDDILLNRSILNDIKPIFINGRYLRISLIMSIQYCMDLTPDIRANIDYIFIFRDNIINNQHKLWNYYGYIFPSFNIFKEILLKCTENYECLVIDNTCKSNNIEDCIYWYKAIPNRKITNYSILI